MIKVLVSAIPDEVRPGERYEPVENANAGWTGPKVAGFFRYSHEGLVLATRERNGYDDSDFYAVVWDADAGEPKNIEYATTRGWTYANSATVDATDEVRAAYDAYLRELAAGRQAAADAAELATPRVGKTVKVIKGRKIPVGTVVAVTWYGEGSVYGGSARRQAVAPPMRVGLNIDGKRVYTDASNVEVTGQGMDVRLPLLRTTYLPLSVCPVCGGDADDHAWWDTRGGVPEACDQMWLR